MADTMEHGIRRDESRVLEREELVTDARRSVQISWGAIFAGLTFVIAASWLLYLFGLAIGVSIADATDMAAVGSGLGYGAIIWLVLSSLLVFFLGALLTARLSGKGDAAIGMLHGVTLWSVGTALMILLGYWGVATLLQTGQSLVRSTASAAAGLTSATRSSATFISSTAADLSDTAVARHIQARLKRRAGEILAETGGSELTAQEARRAIDRLDAKTLQLIGADLAAGDTDSAKRQLAEGTGLSSSEVDRLLAGFSQEFQQRLGKAKNDTDLAGDIQQYIKQKAAAAIAASDARGGPRVSQQEVLRALDQLDESTLQTVGVRVLQGDTEGAKDVLTANTTLTSAQVNDLVDGVNNDVQKRVDAFQREFNQGLEAASTYTQSVLWTVFAAGAMALAVAILGGWLGAETVRRVHVEVRRKTA